VPTRRVQTGQSRELGLSPDSPLSSRLKVYPPSGGALVYGWWVAGACAVCGCWPCPVV